MKRSGTNILLICYLLNSTLWAQDAERQKATVVVFDSVYTFALRTDHKNKTIRKDKTYCSFQNFQLITQQGIRSRRYLHGPFENRSYSTNLLYESGVFDNGLKHGQWLRWYPNGKIRSIEHFKDGNRLGESIWYTSDGTILSHGRYLKNGKYISLLNAAVETGSRPRRWFNFNRGKKKSALKPDQL